MIVTYARAAVATTEDSVDTKSPPKYEPDTSGTHNEPVNAAERAQLSRPLEDKVMTSGDHPVDDRVIEAVRRELWSTTLGRMFASYIKPNEDPRDINAQAHAIAERVFSDVPLTLPRVSAISQMVQDLYIHDGVDKTVGPRIALLNSVVDLQRHTREYESTQQIFSTIPAFVLIGLAGGSPLIRKNANALSRYAYLKSVSFLGRRDANAIAERVYASLNLREMASFKKVMRRYGIITAFMVFWSTYGTASTLYFRIESGSADNAPVAERMWIYGAQKFAPLDQL